jgi:hypothetical protein
MGRLELHTPRDWASWRAGGLQRNLRLSRSTIARRINPIQDMAQRVIDNHGEPNYAAEKLSRAFHATVRALLRDLSADPQQLINAIEHETTARHD